MSDQQNQEWQEKLAQAFADDLEAKAQRAAETQAAPFGARRVSDARALRDWGLRDPQVDPSLFADVLRTRGFTPEEVQQMIVVRENEDDERLALALMQPAQDEALIDALTKIAEYPFRWAMVRGIDDPEEQVRFSDAMDRQWQGEVPGGMPANRGGEEVEHTPPASPGEPADEGGSS